ncbi:MAG: dTDP-4-dehydrorhamnose 3,5-epimerase [Xanthobacteraceae bacterium]
MDICRFDVAGPLVLRPQRFRDHRGFLSETFREEPFAAAVTPLRFVQENHVYSARAGTIRGIHFQVAPSSQGKLVRVTRGAVWDVAVDLRNGSPTFGHHVGVELTAENWDQFWVPIGFGHGYCTLEPDTEVIYKLTAPYDASCERAIAWDDPDLALPWPLAARSPVVSERDRHNPSFKDLPIYFQYGAA